MLRASLLRMTGLFAQRRRDRDLADEIESNLELHIDDNLRAGMSPAEARRQALLRFGGIESAKERYRDRRGVPWLETTWQDIRFAARMLRRSPGFTAVAVLTLALGIGANTAAFSFLDAVLLRPLPYRNPSRLVWISEFAPRIDSTIVPAATFLAWRAEATSFQSVAAYADHLCDGKFSAGGEPVRLDRCAEVTPNFFSLLGVQAALGRSFLPREGDPGAQGAMILGNAFWHRRFGANPAVLGTTIALDGAAYTVVGVLPASFKYCGELSPDAFVPLKLPLKPDWTERDSDAMDVIARMKQGATIAQARAELRAITLSLQRDYPQRLAEKLAGADVRLMSLHTKMAGDARPALLVLMGAVCLVLLIACVNIANLLLARGVARENELAVRATLGAARWRLFRQLLTEGILLAGLGCAAGLLAALGTMGIVRSLQPAAFARFANAHLHGPVLAFALVLSFTTGVLFSMAPAAWLSRAEPKGSLRDAGTRATAGTLRRRYANILVASELAIALTLLAGAGLMIRSFSDLRAVNPGFDPRNVLTLQVTLTETKYPQVAEQKAFFNQLLSRVRSLPGVQSAGGTTSLPLYYGFSRTEEIGIENRPSTFANTSPAVPVSRATPGYFEALGVPLEAGRFFTPEDRDGSLPVAIVSREFARRFLSGQDPVGMHLRFPASHGGAPKEFTIVGTVRDVRYFGPSGQLSPVVFISATQFPVSALTLAVRTRTDPEALIPAVRQTVLSLDPEQPIYHAATMEQRLADSVGPQRFNVFLLGLFAGVATLLAAVGIFAVMHYSVAQRTHEIGIRAALGARPGDVLALIIGEGAKLAIVGTAAGLCVALVLTRLMSSLLFGVRPSDPATLACGTILLWAAALAACWVPAHRAMRVDPMAALRSE